MSPRISFEWASRAVTDAAIDPARWSATPDRPAPYSQSTGPVFPPVGDREAAALPHGVADAHGVGAVDAYEAIGRAGFLLDDMGRVVRYNRSAAILLGDGLDISHDRIRVDHAPSAIALSRLIASCTSRRGSGRHAERIAVIHRATKRPLVVRAVALTAPATSACSLAATILLVSDTEKRSPPTPLDELTEAFSLTNAEARLVLMLEQELSLSEAADRLNIGLETARTHLKRTLAKTQTNRQQDLLMLLNRLRF